MIGKLSFVRLIVGILIFSTVLIAVSIPATAVSESDGFNVAAPQPTSTPLVLSSTTEEYKDLKEEFEIALKNFRKAEDSLNVATEQYFIEKEALPRNEDRPAKKAILWSKLEIVVKEFLNRRIDLLIADIEFLQYNVKFTGEKLPFDTSSNLNKHKMELESIRAKLQQTTGKPGLRDIDRDLRDIKEKFELERRYYKGIQINNQMDIFFARTDDASIRMDELIKKMNENGMDTSKLNGILSDFNNLMNQAKDNHKKTLVLFRDHVGFDSAGMTTDIRNAQDFIRQTKELQKDTKILRSAIADLREFFGETKRLIKSIQESETSGGTNT